MVLDVFWLNTAILFSRPDLIPQLGSALDIIFAYLTGLLIKALVHTQPSIKLHIYLLHFKNP